MFSEWTHDVNLIGGRNSRGSLPLAQYYSDNVFLQIVEFEEGVFLYRLVEPISFYRLNTKSLLRSKMEYKRFKLMLLGRVLRMVLFNQSYC